jgi:hypothetical protein
MESDKSAPQGPPADATNFTLLRIYFQNAFVKYFESVRNKTFLKQNHNLNIDKRKEISIL